MAELPSVMETPSTKRERSFPVACGVRKHTIDGNGRFVVPSTFIEEFGSSFYLTIDDENYIVLYPEQRFREIAEELMDQRNDDPANEARARSIDRIFVFAEAVNSDANNRVQMTESFRETLKGVTAAPTGSVILVGALDRILLLSEESFNEFKTRYLTGKAATKEHAAMLRVRPRRLKASGGAQ